MIKDEERSNMIGNSLEKQEILYTSAHFEEPIIGSDHECSKDYSDKFTDEDM